MRVLDFRPGNRYYEIHCDYGKVFYDGDIYFLSKIIEKTKLDDELEHIREIEITPRIEALMMLQEEGDEL